MKKRVDAVYIHIPFCESICSYCDFPKVCYQKKWIKQYLNSLEKEIKNNYKNELIKTVYIGGGTPSSLSIDELIKLFEIISIFNIDENHEITIECNIENTTKEKLEIMYKNGVNRLSFGVQTFNQKHLNLLNRNHTYNDVKKIINLAKKIGFKNINMDLIAGLTGQSCESFNRSLLKVCSLKPDSITIHTLSMKKASAITGQGKKLESSEALKVAKMLDFAQELLFKEGYVPYYLYRQSRMAGNLENVGWAKPSKQGLYNVYTMDETHTILSCGATGVSKLKNPNTGKIERIFNYKFPYEYINGFDEIINRKNRVVSFYEEL